MVARKSIPVGLRSILAVLVLVVILAGLVFYNKHQIKEKFTAKSCDANSCGAPVAGNPDILPVNDHEHNLKEIVKQMLLLEDHLFQKEKQCKKCIAKHMLTIEALGEEGITLDSEAKHCDLFHTIIQKIRALQTTWATDSTAAAQAVRELRRTIMDTMNL